MYADAHPRVVEEVEKLRRASRVGARSTPRTVVELGPDSLGVGCESVALDTEQRRQLHRELSELGVLSFAISSDASTADLCALARELKRAGAAIQHRSAAALMGFDKLPATIEVKRREFGRRVGISAGPSVQRAIENACAGLDDARVDPATRQACESWIGGALERMSQRVARRRASIAAVQDGPRDLSEVLDVASEALRHAIEKHLANSEKPGDLRSLFQSVETAAVLSSDPEAARIMLDVLEDAEENVLPSSEAAERDSAGDEQCALTIPELRNALADYVGKAPPLEAIADDARAEALAISLQLVLGTSDREAARRAARQVERWAEPSLNAAEMGMVLEALRELARGGEPDVVDALLPVLLSACRTRASVTWQTSVAQALGGVGPATLLAFWPHLAREVLRGAFVRATPLTHVVGRLLSELPAESEGAAVRRVEQLLARDTPSLDAIAAPLHDDFAPFYSLLLRSRFASRIAKPLLRALRDHPPRWPGGQALRALNADDVRASAALTKLVDGGSFSNPPDAVRREWLELLAARLLELPSSDRGAVWVREAITALGASDSAAVAASLTTVLRTRRWLLFPTWPAPCREAARLARAVVVPRIDTAPAAARGT